MDAADYNKQGELYNFKWTTEWNGSLFSVDFVLPDYWEYAEYGRGPTINHNGPGDVRMAIEKWVEIKKLVPRPGKNGKIPTTQQLVFAITKKIHKEGFEGKHLFEKTLDDPKTDALVDSLVDAITAEFEKEIEKELQNM